MQQYQDIINLTQQQPQQQQQQQIQDQLMVQQTPPQVEHPGLSRSGIFKNLKFDPSWVQQTQNPAEAQGAQILRPYQPYQESSRMPPRGNQDVYQEGLGGLLSYFNQPQQPQQAFESQFSELQNQMGGFGEQFTGLETSLGGLGESITAITDRLDSIEQGIKGLKTNDTSQAYTRMNWQPFAEWGRRRN